VTIRERKEPRAAADDTGRSEAMGPSVGVTLRFDWTEPTALAIFRRAGSLWVVFDRPSKPDLEALQRQGGNVIRSVTQIPNEGATILRMDAVAGINPVPRRDGLTWMLDFHRQPIEAVNRLDVTVQPQARRGRVLIPVSDVTTVFALTDPEVGDNLMVVPIAPLSYGMTYPYEFAHFALIPTGQGVVVRPRIDNLQVRAVPQGVEITSPDGLPVSDVTAEDEAQAGHVFSLAIAMTLAGNERGVARPRAEYGEAMARSEFARGFDLIAGQSALTGIGRADVAGEVQEAQGFQTFLSAYKERLREQGLSSIN